MSASAPRRLAKAERPSRAPIVAAAAALVLFLGAVGGYFGLCAWVKHNGLLLPGTTVSGLPDGRTVDLSGMDEGAAAALLDSSVDEELDGRTLTVAYDGHTALLEGELVSADIRTPVRSALAEKNERPFYSLGYVWLGLGGGVRRDLSALSLTETGRESVRRLAGEIARELNAPPVEDSYEVKERTVEVRRGLDGRRVDSETLARDMERALLSGEKRLEVVPETLPISPITGESLSKQVYAEPKSPARAPDGSVTAARAGRSLDAVQAQSILDATPGGESCSIPLTVLLPEFDDEALACGDLLSVSDTYMAGPASRRNNIKLAAEAVDGTLLLPGEEFSFNRTVGERTAARGYQEATVFVAGEDQQGLGGGICQLASALYNCTLYADLEVVQRTNHRFAVSYVPFGLDATVAWPSVDYRFRNSTAYPIRITTEITAKNHLIVRFYGTKVDGSSVKMRTRELSSNPFTTSYQIDGTLAAGTTKVLVHPYTGYKYESYRQVYDGSGELLYETFEASSAYTRRNRVVGVSPYDAAAYGLSGGVTAPEPAPEPIPTPTPEPEPTPEPGTAPAPSLTPWEPVPSQDPVPAPPEATAPGNLIPDWSVPSA